MVIPPLSLLWLEVISILLFCGILGHTLFDWGFLGTQTKQLLCNYLTYVSFLVEFGCCVWQCVTFSSKP